jgi:chloramphenicol 3-O phosphotransferase
MFLSPRSVGDIHAHRFGLVGLVVTAIAGVVPSDLRKCLAVPGKRGFVIVINGASSSGKSTLARAVQDRFPEPLLKFGLDVFLDGDILPMRQIRDGRVDWKTLRPSVMDGFHDCLAALTEAGNNLIVDHVFESTTDFDRLTDAIRGSFTFIVGLHCDLHELERRETARGDRGSGDARADLATVHQFCTYDLELHSDAATVDENADALIDAWNASRHDETTQQPDRALLRRSD